jgi:hypothetical protein
MLESRGNGLSDRRNESKDTLQIFMRKCSLSEKAVYGKEYGSEA